MNHQTWAFLSRIGNIYYFPGRTVPGCWTAIKQEDRNLSFGRKPAYASAFGTHCADVVPPFETSGVPWPTGAATLSFGPNEPSDWWLRLPGYYKYSDKSGARSELFNNSVPPRKWKGRKGKRHDHRKKNKVKQRWKWMARVESEEVRDCRGRRLPQGRGGFGVEIWRQVEIGWQDFMVWGAFQMFDRSHLYCFFFFFFLAMLARRSRQG